MGFRYDMRDKTPQQQAIVRKRDESDKILRKQNTFPKPDWVSSNINGFKAERKGDYEAVIFRKNNINLLELRVSDTAIANNPCGLDKKYIHEWLWETGIKQVNKIGKPLVLTITSYDVVNGELITNLENLKKE